MKTLIIDYGMGNLGSVHKAFERCGTEAEVSSDPAAAQGAGCLVLPGVGSFADGMRHLVSGGWDSAIRKAVLQDRKALLGICLGMQLLADKGEEGGATPGLALIPGEARRLEPDSSETRIPHVGWNEVQWEGPRPIARGIPSGCDFYFVHSYHFVPREESAVLARTPYAGRFVSAVARENVYGVQFHPEKSSKHGFQLIRNFLSLAREGGKC